MCYFSLFLKNLFFPKCYFFALICCRVISLSTRNEKKREEYTCTHPTTSTKRVHLCVQTFTKNIAPRNNNNNMGVNDFLLLFASCVSVCVLPVYIGMYIIYIYIIFFFVEGYCDYVNDFQKRKKKFFFSLKLPELIRVPNSFFKLLISSSL